MQYRLYEQTLDSNIELPELLPTVMARADCTFRLRPAGTRAELWVEWVNEKLKPDYTVWLRVGRFAGGYLLHFPERADFVVGAGGTSIDCYPVTDLPPETVRHLLIDAVIPLSWGLRGNTFLHAGAVALPQGLALFVGDSGAGKSTLTLSFANSGFPVLGDDCLPVEEKNGRLYGLPSYPGVRVWPDIAESFFTPETELIPFAHYSRKKRVPLTSLALPYQRDIVPVHSVYVLAAPEETTGLESVKLLPINPKDSYIEIQKCIFNLDPTDRAKLRRDFETIGRLSCWPRFMYLSFPHDLAWLPAVRTAILTDMRLAEA